MKRVRVALALGVLLAGCTYQAWYEGMQDAQRQECYRLPHGEVQGCLDKVNSIGYEQYRREREEMRQQGTAPDQTRTP